ncbi:MAG: immunoglobulin domain-containing protein, partial [Acidobacteriota bacterium]
MQLSVLCACLLLVATAPTALAQHAFVQSVFNTDARIPAPYRSYDDKVLRTKAFSLIFTGTEVGNYLIWGTDAETGAPSSQGIEQVREVAAAMKQAAEETGRPFIGHFSFPRLPGFFWPDELALQPDDWRPRSLKSDGSPWVRYPPLSTDNHSKHAYNGWVLDITNQSAVEQLLTNLAIVFDQDGPEDVSVGPIYGYVMIDETTLGGLYRADKETDVADPPQDGFATRMRLGNGRKHFDIWWDEDPYYSHLLGPKRAIPLFSESARDSFAAYAAAQGHPEIDTLPADRNEFNHVPDVITLPDHVEFVALSNSTHWGLWTDWCYATWSQFLEKVAREISIAQRGNPDYRGIMLFQTPMMISFRDSGQLPITFQYRNASGQMVTETTTLANHPEFDRINPVNSGMDGDYLLQSPWIAGLLYETAALHIGHEILEPLDEDLAQEFAYQSDRFKYYWMAQGALAREVAHANDKVFGAFVKTRWFEPDSHASRFLPPADFARKFEHVIEPLGGEIVSSIGTRFIAASMIDRFEVDPVKPPSEGQLQAVLADHDGELQDTWLAKIGAFRANFPLGFSEHPWPHTVEHGQAAALHIQAAGGNPDPNSGYEYRWQDSPTADGPWRFTPTGGVDGIQDVSGPSLAIPNPQFDGGEGDTGNNRFYRCRIRDLSGQAGQRFSPAARLTVLAPANPPLTVSTPAPATVTEGSEATFAVTASGGTGTYTYRWYYSATSPTSGFTKLLNSTSNIAGATQTTLSVDPTSGADEGWYKCRVRDGSFATTGLEVYSQPAQLTVEAGSTSDLAVSDPASLNVDVGAPATFSVVASGGTSPYTYRWYFSATSPTSGFVKLLNTA